MAKKGKAPAKKSKGAGKAILVVGSKMKDVVKAAGCMSSADLVEALSARVHTMLVDAAARATGNRRSIIRPYDL